MILPAPACRARAARLTPSSGSSGSQPRAIRARARWGGAASSGSPWRRCLPARRSSAIVCGAGPVPAARGGRCRLADLLAERHDAGPDGACQVEGCGEHRLQDLLAHHRGLVALGRAHPGHPGGRPAIPGPEAGGVGAGGEQLAVERELDDDRGGQANHRLIDAAEHRPAAVPARATVVQVAVAVLLGHLRQRGGDPLAVSQFSQPVSSASRRLAAAQCERDPVGVRQHGHQPRGREHPGQQVFPGDQPPARIAGSRVKSMRTSPALQLHRQARQLAEVPDVVVEDRPAIRRAAASPASGAHVGAGEHRPWRRPGRRPRRCRGSPGQLLGAQRKFTVVVADLGRRPQRPAAGS